jgi:hypothetical protein
MFKSLGQASGFCSAAKSLTGHYSPVLNWKMLSRGEYI